MSEDFVKSILRKDFHAVNFDVGGKHFCFSGWWLLEWGDGDDEYKIYDTKEEFLKDPVFDGKTINEVETENADFEFNP